MGGIDIKLEILNQKATPAFYASSLASRPNFGFDGRIFIDTDNPSTGIYRDTGTAWILIADPVAGTTGTLQQVTTNGSSTNTGISVTANGIGIGTTLPASNRIDIHSTSGIQAILNGTSTTNAGLQLQNAGVAKWRVRNNYNAGANNFGIYDEINTIDRLSITNAGVISLTGLTNTSSRLNVNGATDNSSYQLNLVGNLFASGSIFTNNLIAPSGALTLTGSIAGGRGRFQQNSVIPTGAISDYTLTATAGLYGLYMGVATSGTTWMQSGREDSATTYPLLINPVGGEVILGSSLGINGVSDSVKGGTYIPTLTNVSNTSSLSPQTSFYIRVGNVVTVSTVLVGNCTGAVSNQLRVSIPIGANFTTASQGFGNGTNLYPGTGIMQVCEIVTNSGTTDMLVSFTPSVGVTSFSFKCVFQYQIQ